MEQLSQIIVGLPGVIATFIVTGETDLIVHVAVPDTAALRDSSGITSLSVPRSATFEPRSCMSINLGRPCSLRSKALLRRRGPSKVITL